MTIDELRRCAGALALLLGLVSPTGCRRHDPGKFTPPVPEILCSPTTPQGVCPAIDGGEAICVDGICRPKASLHLCDAAHPQGHCPAGQLCLNGACAVVGSEDLCGPDNPRGACPYGALCFDGLCYPIADDELCSSALPDGVCATGKTCDDGVCVSIADDQRCSPSRPDGVCDGFGECVDGVCTPAVPPDTCVPERPNGRCPLPLVCVGGVCTTIEEEQSCSPANLTGLCPSGSVCAAGYCVPRVGPTSPCSVENPAGVCPDLEPCATLCAQLCVGGTCRPAVDVVHCSPVAPFGYCPIDELCIAGACLPATVENACSSLNHSGACVTGSICLDGVCYPLRDPEMCSAANPAGVCPPGDYCNGGLCLPVPPAEVCGPLNPGGSCDAFERCDGGVCSAPELPDACAPAWPSGRCPTGELCVAGVCEVLTPATSCSLSNPTGACPRDYRCVGGYCVVAVGPEAPCASDNPTGWCPDGMGCGPTGCLQITPDNVCSDWNPGGLCPPGMICAGPWEWGCRIAPGVTPCGPDAPQGPCSGDLVCVGGVCVAQPCSVEYPDGTCPNGLACHDGDCIFPACGPLVPHSGLCPPGYVCVDGSCRSLGGESCSVASPTGVCAALYVCDDRAGSASFGSCVPRCSPGAPDGYCDDELLCQAGWCLPWCASAVVCPYSGQCCAVGEECPDQSHCLPACAAGEVRCGAAQLCCPLDSECRSDGACVPRCVSGTRCGAVGELCCAEVELCSADFTCVAACPAESAACGGGCCGTDEACLHDQCTPLGIGCRDALDCEYNEYCEPTLGVCLPADLPAGEVCQFPPPPGIFSPELEWRWTGLWSGCRPSFDCRAGRCAVLCQTSDDCQGECVGARCQCQNDADCHSGSERCREGVCALEGTSCGSLFENVLSMPTVGDLNLDGIPELVVRAYAGSDLNRSVLLVLDGRDGGDGSGQGSPPAMVLSGDQSGVPWLFAAGHQAVGNLDEDLELEIVAVAATGLAAFDDPVHGPGVVLWHQTAYPLNRTLDGGAPALADFNGDGHAEVFVGAAVLDGRSGALLAAPAGAAALEGGGSRFGGGWLSTAADLDLDGNLELITGNRAYRVVENGGVWSLTPLWQSVTGVPRPPEYTTTVDVPHGYSAVANFLTSASGVDSPEVVNVAGGNLYLFDGLTGALLVGPIPVPAGAAGTNHGGPPTVADFDGDGRPEIAAAGSGCFAVYDFDCLAGYDGAARAALDASSGCAVPPNDRCGSYPSMVGVLWNYRVQDFSSAVTGSSVFDFDGNGANEVLYNDECFFRVFDGRSGAVLMERPNSSRTNSEYPIVVDIDGDRQSELVLVANRDQVSRDHCVSNHDDDPLYADYLHYDELTGAGEYCDLSTFPDHTRECVSGAAGVSVYHDSSGQWVKTRPLWPQHTYHVTDVVYDAQSFVVTVPQQEIPSWLEDNTFRKNVRGFVPLNAPDLQVTTLVASLQHCPQLELNARVANLGALGVGAGVTVRLWLLDETAPRLLASQLTSVPLWPGASEWLSFGYTPMDGDPPRLSFRVEVDSGAEGGEYSECVETNNGAELHDVGCLSLLPVARCRLYSPPFDQIAPLSTVIFDGSASYSPLAPSDPTRIVAYTWSVLAYPDGASPADFVPQGNGSARFSIWLPIAGSYTVALRVGDDAGRESAAGPDSVCTVEAVPKSDIHVQLVWNHAQNDQDLHVVWWSRPGGERALYGADDCYYANAMPDWFGSFPPNPRLDIDDTYGFGPENFNIDTPNPGRYRVYVNYAGNHFNYYDTPTTLETVRIYLKGTLVGSFSRSLEYNGAYYGVDDIWAVADIRWTSATDYALELLPADAPGAVGYTCQTSYDYGSGWWSSNCPRND